MKKITILSIALMILSLAISCGGKAKEQVQTMTIDFSMAYGDATKDNASLNKIAYLKVDGSFGAIDSKPDASTGASSPEGATKSLNAYRFVDIEKYKETTSMPSALRGLLLYGVSPANTYAMDGLSGNQFSQKTMVDTNNNTVVGPKVTGTFIKKEADGSIIIRYAHAGGPNVKPTVYELVSDVNGVLNVSKTPANIKKSAKAIEADTDFNSIELVSDEVKVLYLTGKATYKQLLKMMYLLLKVH